MCVLGLLGGCLEPAPKWKWERAEVGLPRQVVIQALAVDPVDPDRLWAGHYAPNGVATSIDGGQTWTVGTQGLRDNPVFDLLHLSGDLLYAATRDGLLVSTDGGVNWKTPAIEGLPSATAFALATDRTERVYVGFDNAGLYVGDINKDTWALLAPDNSLSTATILSLAVSPDGHQIYAGTAGQGIIASQGAGRFTATAFAGEYVPNLALNPLQPRVAVASMRDRLVRTRNGGESWEILTIPWASEEVVSLLWLPAEEEAPSPEKREGLLWAGTGQGWIYWSQDAGDTWTETESKVPSQGGVLALATDGDRLLAGTWTGVYASSMSSIYGPPGQDSVASPNWTYLSSSLGIPNANALVATDIGPLVGTRAGLFRWNSREHHWTRVHIEGSMNQEPPPGGLSTLAVAPSNQQVAYAGAASTGLYRSDDGGTNWVPVPSDLEVGIRALAVAPKDVDHVYMLAAWERMYESQNGGRNWQARWTGLDVTTEAISLTIDPVKPSTIYLGTDSGLYRSHYEGKDWQAVGHRLDDQTVLTLVARPEPNAEGQASVLYIGATRGAFLSYDAGDTIETWGQGLEQVSVTAILFDPHDSGTVFIGTGYAGLFRSTDGGETWQSFGPPDLAGEVVEAMAWGPSNELFVASAGGVWMGSRDQ